MASLARSFMAPSYLNPYRRPGMPARTVSNSSELSMTSNNSGPSDDLADAVSSRPTTPSFPPTSADEMAPQPKCNVSSDAVNIANPRSTLSRPIAIELPKIRKMNSAPVYTPPEPLSARGDLPGGYFPMHEDPKTRVRRPHPFHHKTSEPSYMSSDHNPRSHAAVGSFVNQGSFMPSSFRAFTPLDHPLPTGKYYPSNYEKRHGEQKKPQAASSSLKSDAHGASGSSKADADGEARRRMQLYQRDMVVQATKALGSAADAAHSPGGVEFHPAKPASPRLVPLGSPGPVTPMELDPHGTSYLDRGRNTDASHHPLRNAFPSTNRLKL